ncbi:MAG: zinc transporter ZntB [Pseudomonadota bacterium]
MVDQATPIDDKLQSKPCDGPLLFGCILNGSGGAQRVSWKDAQKQLDAIGSGETVWLHIDRRHPEAADWLSERADIPEQTRYLLLSEETRPRAFVEEERLVAIMRGLNFNPGSQLDDMIALQVWGAENLVLSFRRRKLQTPRDVLEELENGRGPKTASDLIVRLADILVSKMQLAVMSTNDQIDEIEALPKEKQDKNALERITQIRRHCLSLQRFMSPQHEALRDLLRTSPDWFSSNNLRDVREIVDRLRRYLDDLNVSKESAIVLQDEFDSRAAANSNHTMYILSIVAAIFLPLGFLTGLLGINVGGMPGVDSPIAFWLTLALLLAISGLQIYMFRRLKWL